MYDLNYNTRNIRTPNSMTVEKFMNQNFNNVLNYEIGDFCNLKNDKQRRD